MDNQLGSDSFLAYPPPSQYWSLNIEYDTCSPINYQGIFNWNDLTNCQDFDGNDLITVKDNGDDITLSGTVYVNVISPFQMGSDSGIYRSYPLVQQDFSIVINKGINILGSTGVQLFISSIIGIYEDETDQSFELSVLTQSADYLELISPNIISTPLGQNNMAVSSVTNLCLSSSSFTCGQIFTITINASEINCPPADFSGEYQIGFNVNCRNGEEVCNTFIDDNGGSNIMLAVTSNFIDTTCKPELYEIIFDGSMTFYDDDQFSVIHSIDNDYIIGQDTIYVGIEVNFPDDGSGDNFNIFGILIDNVFVCTADDNVDLFANLDQQNGLNGGCLSLDIDDDGPYNVITNSVENNEYFAQIISQSSNIGQFSFLTFDIGRYKMYVHVQLTLILQNGVRRRLQLIQENTDNDKSNQIRHFLGSTTVVSDDVIIVTDDGNNNVESDDAVSFFLLHIFSMCALFVFNL